MRVCAVVAHPGDAEILCGGTLARYRDVGDDVVLCYVCEGSSEGLGSDPGRTSRAGEKEAQASAEALGAELIWLGLPDGGIFDEETRLIIVEALRVAQPDVILTHALEDAHPDHGAVARETVAAGYLAALPHISTETEALPLAPPLYLMDSFAGVGFLPDHYVDITDVFKQKLELIACYHTQLRWYELHDNIDLLDLVEAVGRFRGFQCGTAYAEGFRVHQVWPQMTAERMLP